MFTAGWCSNCEVMKPVVKDIEGVEIIDAEKNTELVEKYEIMSLPTYIVDNGTVRRETGILPKKLVEEFYEGS